MIRTPVFLVLVATSVWIPRCFAADAADFRGDWPQFRGPAGTGASDASDVPIAFGPSEIAWRTDLPVVGHSSPIVWNDRVFLTGATQQAESVTRHVVCLSRETGELLWNQVAAVGNGEQLHKMNGWASPSCAADGERVVAFFGPGGLHCFDNDGNRLWSRDLGSFPGGWGVGASPIICDKMVIQNCDAEGDSYLVAVDKQSGEDIWRTTRDPKPRGGWSTPILITVDGHQELILNGEFGLDAYDPKTGNPLWNCTGFNGRGTPMPVWGNGLLYVVNGKSGDVYAVRPGGKGNVTDTHMVWHTDRRGGRDLPSPVLANNVLVVISMAGIATGYDAVNGTELWKERLAGNFSGSPVTVSGELVYALAENGDVLVMKPEQKLEIVARNSLNADDDEIFRSSIGISQQQLLIRSDRRLYCVGAKR